MENSDLLDELFKLQEELSACRKQAEKLKDSRQRLETLFLCNKTQELINIYQAFLIGPEQKLIERIRAQIESRLENLDEIIKVGEQDEKSKTKASKT